jgi:hypothetical protein
MGAYVTLSKVLPYHSDYWFSILPNLKVGLTIIPGPPRIIICTKILSSYDALVHIIIKKDSIFSYTGFLWVPWWWLICDKQPPTWCVRATSVFKRDFRISHGLAMLEGAIIPLTVIVTPLSSDIWWSRTNTKTGFHASDMIRHPITAWL